LKPKLTRTRYEVAIIEGVSISIDEGLDDDHGGFGSKKEALEYINNKAMGKHFVLYKTTIQRKEIKTINLKRPRPCHGGWYSGHRVSEEDEKNETKNPFCTDCGYKLRRISRFAEADRLVTVKPLVHREDMKQDIQTVYN